MDARHPSNHLLCTDLHRCPRPILPPKSAAHVALRPPLLKAVGGVFLLNHFDRNII